VAAFQANTGHLWVHTSEGGSQDLGLGMLAGTSPSIAALSGGWVAAFQANTGHLWVYTSEGGSHDLGLGMLAGTSPSIGTTPEP
jgi:hypothetical protein